MLSKTLEAGHGKYSIGEKLRALRLGKEEHVLEEGDAMDFDSSVAHGYRRLGKKPCAAVVISAP